MSQSLIAELEQTCRQFIDTFRTFSEAQANVVPFENSWTAAQVAEHVFKSQSGVPMVLQGSTKPLNRQADEKEPELRSIFLNYELKMQSPDAIKPAFGPHNKAMLINALTNSAEEIHYLADTLDLSEICTSFPFPQMGELTRQEWLYFTIFHTRRHNHQLQHIGEVLSKATTN